MAHFDVAEDRCDVAFNRLDRSGRTDIAALHAQDARLFVRDDIRRINRRRAVFDAEIFDATVWARDVHFAERLASSTPKPSTLSLSPFKALWFNKLNNLACGTYPVANLTA